MKRIGRESIDKVQTAKVTLSQFCFIKGSSVVLLNSSGLMLH